MYPFVGVWFLLRCCVIFSHLWFEVGLFTFCTNVWQDLSLTIYKTNCHKPSVRPRLTMVRTKWKTSNFKLNFIKLKWNVEQLMDVIQYNIVFKKANAVQTKNWTSIPEGVGNCEIKQVSSAQMIQDSKISNHTSFSKIPPQT